MVCWTCWKKILGKGNIFYKSGYFIFLWKIFQGMETLCYIYRFLHKYTFKWPVSFLFLFLNKMCGNLLVGYKRRQALFLYILVFPLTPSLSCFSELILLLLFYVGKNSWEFSSKCSQPLERRAQWRDVVECSPALDREVESDVDCTAPFSPLSSVFLCLSWQPVQSSTAASVDFTSDLGDLSSLKKWK